MTLYSRWVLRLLLLTLATHTPKAMAEAPHDGRVAYWPFAGDASDFSPGGHHGAVFGPLLITDRHGVPNHAYQFDGINDYIDVPSSPRLKPQLPITVSAWIRLDTDVDPWVLFTNEYVPNRYTGVWLNISGTSQTPPLTLGASFGDGGSPGPASRRSKLGTTTFVPGVWYHVAAVLRGATDMDLYVNGVDDGGVYAGTGGPMVYVSGPMTFGRKGGNTGGTNYFYDGAIDDVYFYDRALTADEIMSVYLTGVVLDAGPDASRSGSPGWRATPNPARSGQTIQFEGDVDGAARASIRDINGRLVRKLEAALGAERSRTRFLWDGRDGHGLPVPPGLYFAASDGSRKGPSARVMVIR